MGRGADKKKKWRHRKRNQGWSWNEIQGPRHSSSGASFSSCSAQSGTATTTSYFAVVFPSIAEAATQDEGERKRKREETEAERKEIQEDKEITEELLNSSDDAGYVSDQTNEDDSIQSFKMLLAAKQTPEVEKYIENILAERDEQKKRRKIVCREGREKFRERVMARYDNRCVVTGCTAMEVLQAAHIRSYEGKHTNDPRNGLLLRADIHLLFDAKRLRLTVHDRDGVRVELDAELQKDESIGPLEQKLLHHPALADPITQGLLKKIA